MIMIGATARQSGKTELASLIIKRFCGREKIIGIKVTTVHDGDDAFHGSLGLSLNKNFIIEKSTKKENHKSTDRMSAAGAYETYWVHAKTGLLEKALQQLLHMISERTFIVCESNSLRKIVEPDVFIMIRNLESEIKNSVKDVLEMADITVDFDGKGFKGFDADALNIENGKWVINRY